MGNRYTFVTTTYDWPDWFRKKHGKWINIPEGNSKAISSKDEYSFELFRLSLFEDIRKSIGDMQEPGEADFVLIALLGEGGNFREFVFSDKGYIERDLEAAEEYVRHWESFCDASASDWQTVPASDCERVDEAAVAILRFDMWRDGWGLKELRKALGDEVVEAAFHRLPSIADTLKYSVWLRSIGPNKQKTIAAIQLLTGLNSSEARELVDKPPVVIKEDLSEREAAQLIGLLKDHGAGLFAYQLEGIEISV